MQAESGKLHFIRIDRPDLVGPEIEEIRVIPHRLDAPILYHADVHLIALYPTGMEQVHLERDMVVAPDGLTRIEPDVAVLIIGQLAHRFGRFAPPIAIRRSSQVRGLVFDLLETETVRMCHG